MFFPQSLLVKFTSHEMVRVLKPFQDPTNSHQPFLLCKILEKNCCGKFNDLWKRKFQKFSKIAKLL
jgi:hypothetical protein